jgi:quercetin dioxygenase-like cupin family protein
VRTKANLTSRHPVLLTHRVIYCEEPTTMRSIDPHSVQRRLGDAALTTIVDGLAAADPAAFLPSGKDRRWAPIASNETYSAWAIAWPPGTGLGLHDHAGSAAAVRVVSGELRERFVDGDSLTARWLAPGSVHVLAPDHRHEVVNVGAIEAVSVHVYSPPLLDTAFRDDPEIDLR